MPNPWKNFGRKEFYLVMGVSYEDGNKKVLEGNNLGRMYTEASGKKCDFLSSSNTMFEHTTIPCLSLSAYSKWNNYNVTYAK